jgi:hypothetical protein
MIPFRHAFIGPDGENNNFAICLQAKGIEREPAGTLLASITVQEGGSV